MTQCWSEQWLHTYTRTGMSKESRSCFDRCSSAKGFMAPKNKKHLLRLTEMGKNKG